MEAIVSRGTGSRPRSLVSDRPKPMADVNGRPFLEFLMDLLHRSRMRTRLFCQHAIKKKLFSVSF